MQRSYLFRILSVVIVFGMVCFFVGACSKQEGNPPSGSNQSMPPTSNAGAATAPSNRIDAPAAVRHNLGMTFAKVQSRSVTSVLRIPGRFELLPDATREYLVPIAGRAEILVSDLQLVEVGTPLYRLESAAWRELQHSFANARAQVERANAIETSAVALEIAHEAHRKSTEQTIALWEARVKELLALREVGGGISEQLALAQGEVAEAQTALAEALEKTAEHDAALEQAKADGREGAARLAVLAAHASMLTGETSAQLLAKGASGNPRWQEIDSLTILASHAGNVQSLHATSGTWLQEHEPVLTVVQPNLVRFRAKVVQSDVARMHDGLAAAIVPPTSRGVPEGQQLLGTVRLGLVANADDRTLDLFITPTQSAPWTRAGISGIAEVLIDGASESIASTELAVPMGAVLRDGLTSVLFRRDPKNPDVVIRMEADVGRSDGTWVEIRSGLREGDEVVVDGIYQLMLATSGSSTKGGHFHSDGTFHEGED